MTSEHRKGKIESYGSADTLLADAMKQFHREMWHSPDEHGCWSIHQHLVHIADSEANGYIRCRRLIAEPGQALMAYAENQWAETLNYPGQNVEDALQLFRWLRYKTYILIKSLPESVWSNTAYHPENGDMTLDDWLDVYERHVPEHIQHM